MDKLRTGKGLSKKRKNLIGGNFNVVENDRLANQNDNLKKNRLENQEMVTAKRSPQGLFCITKAMHHFEGGCQALVNVKSAPPATPFDTSETGMGDGGGSGGVWQENGF